MGRSPGMLELRHGRDGAEEGRCPAESGRHTWRPVVAAVAKVGDGSCGRGYQEKLCRGGPEVFHWPGGALVTANGLQSASNSSDRVVHVTSLGWGSRKKGARGTPGGPSELRRSGVRATFLIRRMKSLETRPDKLIHEA